MSDKVKGRGLGLLCGVGFCATRDQRKRDDVLFCILNLSLLSLSYTANDFIRICLQMNFNELIKWLCKQLHQQYEILNNWP